MSRFAHVGVALLAPFLLLLPPLDAPRSGPVQAPSIIVNDPRIREGDSNAEIPVTIEIVELSSTSAVPVTMDWQTSDGTALAGIDYAAAQGVIVIPPGQRVGTVDVPIWGGAGDSEPDETFFINLSNASGAILSDDQGEVTIGNDDNIFASVLKSVAIEGHPYFGGSVVITTTLTPTAQFTTSFQYTFVEGTANALDDFDIDSLGTTVTFPPLSATQTFTTPLVGDALVEPDETFFVDVINPKDAWILDPRTVAIIVDDDATPMVLDGFGGLHGSDGGAPWLPQPPYFGFDIARDLELHGGGYLVLEGLGGLHAGGGAAIPVPLPPYFGFDVAIDFEFLCDGSGLLVLDRLGGLHPGGGATVPTPGTPYFGFDAAADLEPVCPGPGFYVLDRFGGIHAGGVADVIAPPPPYFGFPIAVELELPCLAPGIHVLDGFGGLHPGGGATDPSPAPPYFGFDVAADMEFACPTDQLLVLDRFGGLHAAGGASQPMPPPSYFGFDIARDFEGIRQ